MVQETPLPRLTISETFVTIGHQNDAGNGAPVLAMHERDSAPAATADFGYLWVDRVTPNVLIFTDDTGTDHNLVDPGASAQTITAGWSTGSGGSLTIAANAPLFYTEQGGDDAPGSGQGQIWLRSGANPNQFSRPTRVAGIGRSIPSTSSSSLTVPRSRPASRGRP